MRKDHVGSGIGSVSLIPDRQDVTVGRRFYIDIVYTAGPRGIGAGGAVRFKLPGFVLKPDTKVPVTCSNPDVRWLCSNQLPKTNGKSGSEFKLIDYLFVVLREGRLNEGDSITVRYGADISQATYAPEWSQKWPVEAAVDTDGLRAAPGSGFYLVPNSPVLTFVNDGPRRIEVFIPSYTCVNEPFRVVLRMLDRYNNIVEDYTGKVSLEALTGMESISLGDNTVEAHHRGVLVVEDIRLETAGVHRIMAQDRVLGLWARSNPTKTTKDKCVGLFWGDTHCHSSISADTAAVNAMIRGPSEDYDYARNRSALDFCMVTDHIETQSEQDWEETRRAAGNAYEPGRFVAFSGFEATYQPLRREGDKNVYFFDDDAEWVNRGTTEELYSTLKKRKSRALVIPHLHSHHINWDRHDPELERVVEVYSHWGCGLSRDSDPPLIPGLARRPEHYVHHALEQGAKLGFIASADHSYGHPGDDFWWDLSNHNGGLAAVFSAELTREGIWKGVWSRRCYGTTRARILLEFDINGHVMGEEIAESVGTRVLAIKVYGTSAISEIRVVKNGRIVQRFPGDRRIDMGLEYRDDAAERGTDYYYVHVRQEDGEQAWSSPIWVIRPA